MTEPHMPKRDDDVAAWLKRERDSYDLDARPAGFYWHAVNSLLDRYRECADYGLTLRPEDDHRGDP